MSGNDNSSSGQSTSNFSFFNGKEPPKLPIASASSFSCFSFGQPSQSTIKNAFSFGSQLPKNSINFDDKITSIQQSLTAISNQPRPSFDSATKKTISERAEKIAILEYAFSEVKGLKIKVLSLENCIGKLLMDELDEMKEDINSSVGFQNNSSLMFSLSANGGSNAIFKQTTKVPFSFGDSGVITNAPSSFGSVRPKPVFTMAPPQVTEAAAVAVTEVTSSSSQSDTAAKRDHEVSEASLEPEESQENNNSEVTDI